MSLARTLDRRDNQRAIATERALRARDALAQRAPAVAVLESQLSTVEPIDRADIEIHAESLTESGVLSGDAHAILNLDDARIGLVLVDVAGHGAEPTVAALRIKDSLAQSLRHGASPVQALVEVSPLLGETAEMATAVVADMQTAGGHLRLVVAGHPPPLLIGNNTVDELAATGPLLHSSIPGAWTHHELTLGEGDTLMLYTDGLTQRPLGDLTKQLRDASSLAETVEWLLRGSGEPAFRDDVSLILLRRLRTRPKVVVDVADTAHNLSPVQSRFFLETR
jgi:serine phosphatase RsbU (regulator of sigma subunit)